MKIGTKTKGSRIAISSQLNLLEMSNAEISTIFSAIRGVLEDGHGMVGIRRLWSGQVEEKRDEMKMDTIALKEALLNRREKNTLWLSSNELKTLWIVIGAHDEDLSNGNEERTSSNRSANDWMIIDNLRSAISPHVRH